MIVKINNIDITSYIITDTFELNKTDNFNKELKFNIDVINDNIQAGQEVIVEDGLNRLYGGIVGQIEKNIISPTKLSLSISTTNYESILARRTVNSAYTNKTAGFIVKSFLASSLAQEGITEGLVDDGILIPSISWTIRNIRDILDEIAEMSGFVWWIDDFKKLYFTASKTYTDCAFKYDVNGAVNNLDNVEYPKFTEDLTQYANTVYLIGKLIDGKTTVNVSAVNTDEILRMQSVHGGSGVYGKVVNLQNLSNTVDAEKAAQKILQDSSVRPIVITLQTESTVDINQKILINIPIIGVSNQTYVITQIKTRMKKDRTFIHALIIKNIIKIVEVEGVPTPKPIEGRKTWVDEFKALKNTNKIDQNSGNGALSAIESFVEKDNGILVYVEGLELPEKYIPTFSGSQLTGIIVTNNTGTRTVPYSIESGDIT